VWQSIYTKYCVFVRRFIFI